MEIPNMANKEENEEEDLTWPVEIPDLPNKEEEDVTLSMLKSYVKEMADIFNKCRKLLPTLVKHDLSVVWKKSDEEEDSDNQTMEMEEKKNEVVEVIEKLSSGVEELYHQYNNVIEERIPICLYMVKKTNIPAVWTNLLRQLNHMGLIHNDNVLKAFNAIAVNMCNYADVTVEFSTAVAEAGCMDVVYENIAVCRFFGAFEGKQLDALRSLSMNAISIAHNVVRRPGNVKYFQASWKPALLELVERSDASLVRLLAIFVLSYTAEENQHDLLAKCGDVIKITLNLIANALEAENRRAHGFSVEELLDVLVVLTVQTKMQKDFLRHDGVSVLMDICKSEDNPNDIAPATRIFCNLILNKDLREKLTKKYHLDTFLKKLQSHANLPDEVKVNLNSALWVLKGRKKSTNQQVEKKTRIFSATMQGPYGGRFLMAEQIGRQASFQSLNSNKTLFISYCNVNKTVVHQIWHELQNCGVRCWVDQEQMLKGSTVDAMAAGIEHCKCVLLCMSSAYKVSYWGRMEAQYAAQLRKPMLHAVLEHRYKPDGWAGLIRGSDVLYEFSERYDFKEMFAKLLAAFYTMMSSASGTTESTDGTNKQ